MPMHFTSFHFKDLLTHCTYSLVYTPSCAESGQDYLREVEWKALDNAAEQGGYVQTRGNAVPSRRLLGLDW